MTILHCYTSTYNDLYMVRHYVRHWSRYAAKIFVYDDDSTDGTAEFLDSCAPLVERKSPGFHGIDELLLQEMRNREYRLHSRGAADWVVIGDSDELHHHPDFLNALDQKRSAGYQVIVSHGYDMFSDNRPGDDVLLTDAVKLGIPDVAYNRVIFDPMLEASIWIGHHGFSIADGQILDFTHRRQSQKAKAAAKHEVKRRYKIEDADTDFKMLHMKFLGVEHIKERHDRIWSRSSDRNKQNRWGTHLAPGWSGRYGVDWYLSKQAELQRVLE